MKDWFEDLQRREQIFVAAGGVAVILTLLYLLLIQPLYANSARRTDRVTEKQQLLAWMESESAQIRGMERGTAGSEKIDPTQPLVVIIDRTARQRGLESYLTRNQPTGDNSIRARLERAPFDGIVQWLGVLQGEFNLQVSVASIDRAAPEGSVTALLTLERPEQ